MRGYEELPNESTHALIEIELTTFGNSSSFFPNDDNNNEDDDEEEEVNKRTPPERSHWVLFGIIFFYTMAFSFVIPAYPVLLLQLTGNNTSQASMIMGGLSALRYFLEFFSSQYFGRVSDKVGRKPVLLLALNSVVLEFFVVAIYPSLTTVIIAKILSGLFDCTSGLSNAIITDLARHVGRTTVANLFGQLYAVMGFGFVFGPLLGSLAIAFLDVQVAFGIATLISLPTIVVTSIYLPETNLIQNTTLSNPTSTSTSTSESEKSNNIPTAIYSYFKSLFILLDNRIDATSGWNPFLGLQIFFSNPELRKLSAPYILGASSTGLFSIWLLYMKNRFDCSVIEIGIYFTFIGLLSVFVQGFLVQFVIPRYWSERSAAFYCSLFLALEYILYGLSNSLVMFVTVSFVFAFSSMHTPALQAVIAKKGLVLDQGSIQGALTSMKMLTAFISSLVFPFIFSAGLQATPAVPGLPFFVAAGLSFISAMSLLLYFRTESKVVVGATTIIVPKVDHLQLESDTTIVHSGSMQYAKAGSSDIIIDFDDKNDDCINKYADVMLSGDYDTTTTVSTARSSENDSFTHHSSSSSPIGSK